MKIKFRVKSEEFDDYRDLIYHVSNLDAGNYVINYIVSYKEASVTLNQSVTIKELVIKDSEKDEPVDSNIDTEVPKQDDESTSGSMDDEITNNDTSIDSSEEEN